MNDVTLGSTPTMVLHVNSSFDLTELKMIYITFEQRGSILTKHSDESGINITPDSVEVTLTQEETLVFKPGQVNVQLCCVSYSGHVLKTNIVEIEARPSLIKGVIK